MPYNRTGAFQDNRKVKSIVSNPTSLKASALTESHHDGWLDSRPNPSNSKSKYGPSTRREPVPSKHKKQVQSEKTVEVPLGYSSNRAGEVGVDLTDPPSNKLLPKSQRLITKVITRPREAIISGDQKKFSPYAPAGLTVSEPRPFSGAYDAPSSQTGPGQGDEIAQDRPEGLD